MGTPTFGSSSVIEPKEAAIGECGVKEVSVDIDLDSGDRGAD